MKIPGNANLQIGVPLFECESKAFAFTPQSQRTHLKSRQHTRHFVVAGLACPESVRRAQPVLAPSRSHAPHTDLKKSITSSFSPPPNYLNSSPPQFPPPPHPQSPLTPPPH